MFLTVSRNNEGIHVQFESDEPIPEERREPLVRSIQEIAAEVFSEADKKEVAVGQISFFGGQEHILGKTQISSKSIFKPWRKNIHGADQRNKTDVFNIEFLLNHLKYYYINYDKNNEPLMRIKKCDISKKINDGNRHQLIKIKIIPPAAATVLGKRRFAGEAGEEGESKEARQGERSLTPEESEALEALAELPSRS